MARTIIRKTPVPTNAGTMVAAKAAAKPRWRLTHSDRKAIKLAEAKKSTAKSIASEIGKSIRSLGANFGANRMVRTVSEAQTAQSLSRRNDGDTVNKALQIYNQIIEGNAQKEGKNQDDSTTEVGGGGSIIGG